VAGAIAAGCRVVGGSSRGSIEVCAVISLINGLFSGSGAIPIRGFGGHFSRLTVYAGIEFILDIGLVWSQGVVCLRVRCV
jgi:hypothetical protein